MDLTNSPYFKLLFVFLIFATADFETEVGHPRLETMVLSYKNDGVPPLGSEWADAPSTEFKESKSWC